MNGPMKIYQTRQIIRHDAPIEVPNCMYKMKNLLSDHSVRHVSPARKNLDISEQKYQTHPEMAALQIHQEHILKQLAELKEQMSTLRSSLNMPSTPNICDNYSRDLPKVSSEIKTIADLVINVKISNPPYSLLVLQKLWKPTLNIVIYSYIHSSVVNLSTAAQEFISKIQNNSELNSQPQLLIRLIWKNVDGNMEMITSSTLNSPILGEINILRYMSRIGPIDWNYENLDDPTEIDSILDVCYLLSRSRTKTEKLSHLQTLNGKLGKSQWIYKNEMSVADIAASSVIKQVMSAGDVNVNLTKWLQRCESVLNLQ